jgi:nucleoside-triphosphatase THEP1
MAKAIDRIIRTDLIILDDIGLLPVSAEAAEGLYRLVDAADERRSLAVSSNLHPSGFDEIMPKTLATATVDRLLHHANVVVSTLHPGSAPHLVDGIPLTRSIIQVEGHFHVYGTPTQLGLLRGPG